MRANGINEGNKKKKDERFSLSMEGIMCMFCANFLLACCESRIMIKVWHNGHFITVSPFLFSIFASFELFFRSYPDDCQYFLTAI